ncbi:hypothetical protein ACT51I_00225 [Pseudomonas aeruginosa]
MNLIVRNKIIIALVQALLGAISENFRAVLIDFSQGVDVRFFLVEDLAEDREEIDDVITEFDSLVMGVESVSITYGVAVGEVRIDFSGDSVVPVYIKRE